MLVGVPYAMKAADAETLGGLPAAFGVRAGYAQRIIFSSGYGLSGPGCFGLSRCLHREIGAANAFGGRERLLHSPLDR